MIKVENLSYSFPQKDLFENISFTLEAGQHCAFIGSSGSGKSTLIDMIMNPDQYMYDGTLEVSPTCKLGYVSQFSKVDKSKDLTVFEFIGEEFIKLQNELTSICSALETASDIDALLEKYQQTLDSFHAISGDDFESNINKKLNLANLKKYENLMISKLSGGEFKLVQVIKEMLIAPDLMIMDEPDVFLDFENLSSLRKLINSYKGTLLIITHNRYLLNHCFDKIIHLENKELQEFDGNYIDYNLSLLESKIELQELAIADDIEIERNEQIIDKLRFISTIDKDAARGKSLHARVKILERLEARRINAPFIETKQAVINFAMDKAPSASKEIDTTNVNELSNVNDTTNLNDSTNDSTIVRVNDFSVSFDELLFEHVSFEINSTDKVALIGANGTGKTTLLREIFKNNHEAIEIKDDVNVAYLSQAHEEILNESNTILDEFFEAGFQTNDEIRSYLSDYGFEDEVLHQKIGSLSGGEKNLLQLAKVSTCKANLLLLDEPTSHLDTYSQISLEKAIENYNGAILMISHDFYFIVNCMDYVLILDDKTLRKMSMRKFRKMIYENYFDKDYLEIEQKKKALETRISSAIKDKDIALAKVLLEELKELIQLL